MPVLTTTGTLDRKGSEYFVLVLAIECASYVCTFVYVSCLRRRRRRVGDGIVARHRAVVEVGPCRRRRRRLHHQLRPSCCAPPSPAVPPCSRCSRCYRRMLLLPVTASLQVHASGPGAVRERRVP